MDTIAEILYIVNPLLKYYSTREKKRLCMALTGASYDSNVHSLSVERKSRIYTKYCWRSIV